MRDSWSGYIGSIPSSSCCAWFVLAGYASKNPAKVNISSGGLGSSSQPGGGVVSLSAIVKARSLCRAKDVSEVKLISFSFFLFCLWYWLLCLFFSPMGGWLPGRLVRLRPLAFFRGFLEFFLFLTRLVNLNVVFSI